MKMNEPAFPAERDEEHIPGINHKIPYAGLTKLEYAAIKAMQGLLANPLVQDNPDMGFEEIAQESAAYSKALFAELEKENE